MTNPDNADPANPRASQPAWLSRGPSIAVGVLLAGAFAVSFASWGTSGSRGRNSYELVRSVRTLELLEGIWATLATVWFALPLVVAIGLIAAALNWRYVTAGAGLFVGTLLILGWFQVKDSILGVDTGATIGVLNGIALSVSSALLALFATREKLRK